MAITLSTEDQQRLASLDKTVVELRKELARAKSAGIDVDELSKELERVDALRKGLLKVYSVRSPE